MLWLRILTFSNRCAIICPEDLPGRFVSRCNDFRCFSVAGRYDSKDHTVSISLAEIGEACQNGYAKRLIQTI